MEHDVQVHTVTTGLRDISLNHCARTNLNMDEIDLSVEIFIKKLFIPLFISRMRRRHDFTQKLNAFLSQAVELPNIGMEEDNQRAVLENEDVKKSFRVDRENVPSNCQGGWIRV